MRSLRTGAGRVARGKCECHCDTKIGSGPFRSGATKFTASRTSAQFLPVQEKSSMQLIQSAFAIAFCAMGAIVLAVAHYQTKHKQIGKVPLISARAKHVVGLLGIIIGVLIFAAELMLRR